MSQQVIDLFSARKATLSTEVAKMAEAYRRKYGHEPSRRMAARAAVAEVQRHHAVWSLSELRFEVGRALPPGASPDLVREAAELAVTPGSGTGVLLVTAPEVTTAVPVTPGRYRGAWAGCVNLIWPHLLL